MVKLKLSEVTRVSTDRHSVVRCNKRRDGDLHKVALEELLQPLLSCRVGQVTDVEAAAISRAGGVGIGRLLGDGGVGQSGSHVSDGSVSGLVLLGRHFGEIELIDRGSV